MGALVEVGGALTSIVDSVFTHFGNCGSNVTPLLSLVDSSIVHIARNVFNFGCTLYSARSIVRLLWEENESSEYLGLGRDGSVIATFYSPFRVEYVAFLGNIQTDNPGALPCLPFRYLSTPLRFPSFRYKCRRFLLTI